MRIYNKVVIDIVTGNVLEQDSYEYDGPVTQCKGENRIFQQQQGQSFGSNQMFSDNMLQFYNVLNNQMQSTFGRQSDTFNLLSNRLRSATRSGPGEFNLRPRRPGAGGAGGGGGRGGGSAFGRSLEDYGYKDDFFDVDFKPTAFYGAEEEALRAEASEQNVDAFTDAARAFGARSQQLGGYSPQLESAGLEAITAEQAANEAQAMRDVSLFGAGNAREDYRQFAPLRTQLALGESDAFARATALKLQDAMQRRAIGASAGAAAQANQQRAYEFNQRMRLAGAELQSENFYRGIGALGSVAGLQDATGWGQLGLGALTNQGNIWGGLYGQGSQGMVQTRSNPLWGQLLGGTLGGLTGGFSGLLGGFGGGGGGSQWGLPSQQQPWNPYLMAPGG